MLAPFVALGTWRRASLGWEPLGRILVSAPGHLQVPRYRKALRRNLEGL